VAGEASARRVVAGERFGWERPQSMQEPTEAVLEPPAVEAQNPAPEAPRPVRARRAPKPLSAVELFEQAHLARRAGRMGDAAAAYGELMREHPGDRRAGLSAFEVGRIRMDALGDPRGAIEAFRQALTSKGAAAYREDAMARIAFAHDALGEQQACRDARERYLSRYPAGVHRAALSARCGDVGQ
jgi:TolA-binding protein